MKIELLLAIFGTLITVASFFFAIYEYRKNKTVKNLYMTEINSIHKHSALALGAIQGAKNNINNNNLLLTEIGRNEGLCNSILHLSAKLYCNMGNYSKKDIDLKIDSCQIPDYYRDIYYMYTK